MKILITAGPTREPIDAVRFISNRSSGKMGVALAAAAREAGYEVTLLLGPGCEAGPTGVRTLRFDTGAELAGLLEEHFGACDVLLMAAAVADYQAKVVAHGKMKRGDELTLSLEPTPDLVAQAAKKKVADQKIVAFALEEAGEMEARARRKLERKGVDAIVANPLSTMERQAIEAVLLTARGEARRPGEAGAVDKKAFAAWLIDQLATI